MKFMYQMTIRLVTSLLILLCSCFYSSVLLAHPCPAFTTPPLGTPGNTLIQEFPPDGTTETAWKIRFAHATGKGLYVTGAWFKKTPTAPWMRVLWDARVADIFVPYHTGSPRYYDLTNFNFPLVTASAADAGPCGRIIDGKVIHEIKSTGKLWKDDTEGQNAHDLVLWATLDSANYNYIMRYAFRSDGTIALRLGATSRNLPNRELEAHMHNALWRIDMDLNGFTSDSAFEYKHNESIFNDTAFDRYTPYNNGKEGGMNWQASEFSQVHIRDKTKNSWGHNLSYDFRPVRAGKPRHKEAFAHDDFWVTRYKGSENTYKLVDSYVNGESILDTDIVVWHISPLHHDPRDEDGFFDGPFWRGVALLMWSGIDIRPRNIFEKTPLFP